MFRRILLTLVSLMLLLSTCSCGSILEGHTLSVTPHVDTVSGSYKTDEDAISVASYTALKAALRRMILNYSDSATINIYSFDRNNVSESVEQACVEMAFSDPLGIYAVYYISSNVTQIVSYYQAKININYRHTRSQISSMVSVYSERDIKTALNEALITHSNYIVLSTILKNVTEDLIKELIEVLYYSYPLEIVTIPTTYVTVYSGSEEMESIIEISMGYNYSSALLSVMTGYMNNSVQKIVDTVAKSSDEVMLLSMCRSLVERVEYDSDKEAVSASPNLITESTAFGALQYGTATSEGYALAYKALCDKLGIECYVVVGTLNGARHVWNIVGIGKKYYHVDISMCDTNGIETAFLKQDKDFNRKYYSWDRSKYYSCEGDLTYYSVLSETLNTQTSTSGTETGQDSGSAGSGDLQQGDGTNGKV